MDIYRLYAEDEKKRFIFHFSYKPSLDLVLSLLSKELGREPYIYDIFPEPNNYSETLSDILSVKTSCGKEMFIPAGLTVNYFDQFRILFGEKDESENS